MSFKVWKRKELYGRQTKILERQILEGTSGEVKGKNTTMGLCIVFFKGFKWIGYIS